jgi:nucleoside-triphosphatase
MKWAITGRPGSGKTTICKRLIKNLKSQMSIGGMLTREIRDEQGRRLGFELLDIVTGELGTLAHVQLKSGPRVGKYHVNVADVERVGVPAIEHALKEADLIVIDEIAPMELKSLKFASVVEQVLRSDKPMLVTFKQHLRHPLVENIRKVCRVYEIREGNRDEIFKRLLSEMEEALC